MIHTHYIKSSVLVVVSVVAALFFTSVEIVRAGPADYRQCSTTEPCEIGEFFYDDSYDPVVGASCTLTVKNPDGSAFLTDEPATEHSDGWYSVSVITTSQPAGLYRGQFCCTETGNLVCIDKSFEIASQAAGSSLTEAEVANAVWDATRIDHDTAGTFGENLQNPSNVSAADIWSYPSRSLTTFGTLVADIWSYSARSLNDLTTMVAGIWNFSGRNLDTADLGDGSSLALQTDVTAIGSQVTTHNTTVSTQLEALTEETRTERALIERTLNRPIIETFIEEGVTPPQDLTLKVEQTRQTALLLQEDITNLKLQVKTLNRSWNQTNYQVALAEMDSATRVLGAATAEAPPDSINGLIGQLNQSWNSPVITNISSQATSTLTNIDSITREVRSYGKTFISQQYLGIAETHIAQLEKLIGQQADEATADTLFGYLKDIEQKSQSLTESSAIVAHLLENWSDYEPAYLSSQLKAIKSDVLIINQIPDIAGALEPKAGDSYYLENQALALQGVIDANLRLLAQDANQVMAYTWLELGSIVFKSLVQNPSSTISQEATMHYYLPTEVTAEDIISLPEGMTTTFDPERNALYVTGKIQLAPNETKIVSVEVEDIWVIPADQINSMRKQVEILFEPLKGTSYFAQGSTLKAGILVSLDNVELIQQAAVTPDAKIKAYREARIELDAAQRKMTDLESLVTSAGSVGTIFGFIGGVQTVAVWGLVLILVAGFVFLAMYLRLLVPQRQPTIKKEAIATRQLLKKSEDMSTLALLTEIIALKLGLPAPKLKWVALTLLMLSLAAAMLLASSTQATLLSPLP